MQQQQQQRFLILLLCLSLTNMSFSLLQEEIEFSFSKFLQNIISNGKKANISELAPEFQSTIFPNLRAAFEDEFKEPRSEIQICSLCSIAFPILYNMIQDNSIEAVELFAINTCEVAGIATQPVCKGVIKAFIPEVTYLLRHTNVTTEQFCGNFFMSNNCGDWKKYNNWTLDMSNLPPKSPIENPTLPETSRPTMKILQLTDVHLLPEYVVGTTANCKEPYCCTLSSGFPQLDNETGCGYWGDYNCDMPVWTFEHMLTDIKAQHGDNFSYIYYTGDQPGHVIWNQSREKNLNYSSLALDLIVKYFPNSRIIPTIGNHESFPTNSFPTSNVVIPEFNLSWLYRALAEIYKDYLSQEALKTFQKDGYFALNIMKGLKVISINYNYCNTNNLWLNKEWNDPAGELKWLMNELLKSEENNEKVHILNHGPPGNSDCLPGWARAYNRLIVRFENTVVASFYGHTHMDSFFVHYDDETASRPASIAFVSPSVMTTYNPSYRIYTFDGPYDKASFRVLDMTTYSMNLTAANVAGRKGSPKYINLYDPKVAYNMKSLFPRDYAELSKRLANNDEVFRTFRRYYYKDHSKGHEPITETEKRKLICETTTNVYFDFRRCNELLDTSY